MYDRWVVCSPIPLSSPTRALGAMITPDNSSTHIADIELQINRIKHIMIKKKASIQTMWTILKQCVYPKFTYVLKFSNISMHDLNNLSGSLRDLIRKKCNASHLPNAILFADSKCSYGHTYYDLMAHTLRDKESTMDPRKKLSPSLYNSGHHFQHHSLPPQSRT